MMHNVAGMEVLANILFILIGMILVTIIVLSVAGVAAALGASFRIFFLNGLWALWIVPLLWCYGTFVERNQYKIKNVEIESEKLPESFDNFKIVHISDLHLISFKMRARFLQRIVNEINRQDADMVAFTGDLVSFGPDELRGLDTILTQVKAKEGVFSVLGNHDYSVYTRLSDSAQKQNVEHLKKLQKELGWHLLLNENRTISRQNEKISVVGVENVSVHSHFDTYGDLTQAMGGADGTYKILLSHDPTHWRKEVVGKTDVDLTLSGHTHAMQFSVFGWSPSSIMYKEYKGLYAEGEQNLYVNIGLGETVLRPRVGAKPEITVLNLKSKK